MMFSGKCEPPPVRSGEILYVAISAADMLITISTAQFDVDPEKGPFQKERLVFSGGVQIKERVA